jgi:hypothetical protein
VRGRPPGPERVRCGQLRGDWYLLRYLPQALVGPLQRRRKHHRPRHLLPADCRAHLLPLWPRHGALFRDPGFRQCSVDRNGQCCAPPHQQCVHADRRLLPWASLCRSRWASAPTPRRDASRRAPLSRPPASARLSHKARRWRTSPCAVHSFQHWQQFRRSTKQEARYERAVGLPSTD